MNGKSLNERFQTVFLKGNSSSDLGLWSIVGHFCLPLTLLSLSNQVIRFVDVTPTTIKLSNIKVSKPLVS